MFRYQKREWSKVLDQKFILKKLASGKVDPLVLNEQGFIKHLGMTPNEYNAYLISYDNYLKAVRENIYMDFPLDFKYCGIDFDYEMSHSCEKSGCDQHICRCGKIDKAWIKAINLNEVIDNICRSFKQYIGYSIKDRDIDVYCVDRLIHIYQMWDKEKWNIEIGGMFYGDEVESILFSKENEFKEDLMDLMTLTDDQKIEFVLMKEYDYLLKNIENKEWSIGFVDSDLLVAPNKGYVKKIDSGHYHYENIPIGVYRFDGNKYGLIDGYHRYTDIVLKDKQKMVKIIFCNA